MEVLHVYCVGLDVYKEMVVFVCGIWWTVRLRGKFVCLTLLLRVFLFWWTGWY